VTIWSFHLQYQAPPAISLKAPTLMYVFILVALRALSFEPRLVLLAGGTAVLLWLALIAYAVLGTTEPMPITRNFLVYTTSTSVLLGAEFDKAVSILMVTLILAVMLVRARKLLIRSATEQQAAAELSRFFAPEVAARIRTTDRLLEPGHGEYRPAAILFVDLRGFTTLTAALAPSEVMRLLADYQDRVVAVAHAHGGSIDKFMGDGILASFGATLPRGDYAAAALAAVEDLRDTAEAWAAERRTAGLPAPRLNAALASGEIVFGTVGNAMRLEYTVIGDPVNLAAKLEKHCKVEQAFAVASAETMRAARDQGFAPRRAWQDRAGALVDGVADPVDLVVLREGP
jgi:adenylate cyclase